jgi:hypothetical protein
MGLRLELENSNWKNFYMENRNEIVLYQPTVNDIKKKIRFLPNLDEHLKHRKDLYFVDHTSMITGFNNLGKSTMNLSNMMNQMTQMINRLKPHNRRKDKIKRIFE